MKWRMKEWDTEVSAGGLGAEGPQKPSQVLAPNEGKESQKRANSGTENKQTRFQQMGLFISTVRSNNLLEWRPERRRELLKEVL